MEFPTSLTRSTVTVAVPGIVALSPWVLALVQHTDATLGLKEHPTLGHAFFFAAVVVVGTICEGIGTYIESKWDTERDETLEVQKYWFHYLSSVLEKEPVGYRYLSRLVTAMYFELSMVTAVPVFAVGAGTLAALRFPVSFWGIVGATLLLAGGAAVFFGWQASQTHQVICTTRREVLKRCAPSS